MRVFWEGFVVFKENFLFLTASLQNELLVDHSCFLFLLLLLLPQNWIVRVVFWQVWGWRYPNGFSLQGRCSPLLGGLVWPLSDLGITFVTCWCIYKCHILCLRFSGYKAVVAILKLWLRFFPSSLPFFSLFFLFFIYFCLLLFLFPFLPFRSIFSPFFLPLSIPASFLPSFSSLSTFLSLSSPLPLPSFSCSLLLLLFSLEVWLFCAPWTVAHQAPLSMGFPRQEYWSGLPFLSPGDLPEGVEPTSSALAGGFFSNWATGQVPLIATDHFKRQGSLV